MARGDILLQVTAAGLCTAYLNQPVEVPAPRLRLREFGVSGFPQNRLRLGYGPEVPHAQRRELRHVICG
ncbi:hypothetical protein [Tardibacter chloracetimidivorans]|uniref:hypothetical protein n=1 Tax=Tardibacter chloracetimidivorans TaxID=1921510 RepID=UPI0013018493|nr:hypothetical protein [Tardibacter chloracetimidivorans]